MIVVKVQRNNGNACLVYNEDKSIYWEGYMSDSFCKSIHLGKMNIRYFNAKLDSKGTIVLISECTDITKHF